MVRYFVVATVLALPGLAAAADRPLNYYRVFLDAAWFNKAIMLGLIASAVAAVVICAIKLMSGPRLAGGSAFVSGLRVGGPLAGLLGATFSAFWSAVGLANAPETPSLKVMAPGIAESVQLFGLGLIAGLVAVVGKWLVDAHIDRTILKD